MRIVTALLAEAKPIIELYNLTPMGGNLIFPIYQKNNYFLVVSGIGKINSAIATTYLHLKSGESRNQPFLNIGIAGHHRPIKGMPVVANKITEKNSGDTKYPPQIIFESLQRSHLITVDKRESMYETDAAYDMEGYAFYISALRYTTAELAQSLKIISDHPTSSATKLDATKIENLIRNRLNEIDRFVQILIKLSRLAMPQLIEPSVLENFYTRWHFTITQKHQLKKIVRRWLVLTKEDNLSAMIPIDCPSAKKAIETLENKLNARSLFLHPDKI
ncbi:MAG: hypothetical protein CL402_03155 [Acidiferrobacteraceae bacterium]|nr:hypothetical protein [Acidiferrobacteraceae bacterium]|tara:strand:- start:21377 stop:22201 length:825 start_codon:yes stop_codon:yes gene_type:complete